MGSSSIGSNIRYHAQSIVHENLKPIEKIEEDRKSTDYKKSDESDLEKLDEEFIDHDSHSDNENFVENDSYDEDFMDFNSDEDDVTIAHIAAANNDLETLVSLRERNLVSLLFQANSNGWTPLHEAVRSNNTNIVRFLLQNGAHFDYNNYSTPIQIDLENSEIIELLESYTGIKFIEVER